MARPSAHKLAIADERREQAVLARVAATVAQLEIDHTLRQAITEHIFDSSRVAMLRAVHSADFIHRLIDITPSLSAQQHQALRGIADDLIQLACQAPQDAHDQAKLQQDAGQSQRKPDALHGFLRDVQTEWEALKEDWASVAGFWRK